MTAPPDEVVDPGVAHPGIAPNTSLTELDEAEITHLWSDLTNLKVPIFVAERSADRKAEFVRPMGWQNLTAEGNAERLADWRPGMAVCAVTGGPLVVVDVDPRNGGDVDGTRDKLDGLGVIIFAEIETPGGGAHFYVAGHRDIASGAKLPGWPGVDVQSDGKNVFLPGTSRPKYDGRGYRIRFNDLDKLVEGGVEFGTEALADALAEAKATMYVSDGPADDVAAAWDGTTPLSGRGTAYLDSSVRRSADRVAEAATGGRNQMLNDETLALARYTAGTGYPSAEVITEAMVAACTTNGLIADDGLPSVHKTIRSAIRGGARRPRALVLPDRPGLAGMIDVLDAAHRSNGKANGTINGTIVGSATITPATEVTTVEATGASVATARLDVIVASTVVRRRVAYVWGQRIPLGAVTVMPGEEGIGKSTVGARIIADVTKGILPGEFFGSPKDVVVLAAEDGIEDVFVPRLAEAGADLARVHIIRGRIGPDDGLGDVIVPRDLDLLAEVVTGTSAALVWIDSLVTTLPDDMKSIAYKDTAKVLRAIGGWAEAHRVAVVAPWHLNKATGSDAAVRMMDSRAFRTAVRSVLLVVPDPDAEEGVTQGIVALDKANAGTLAVPALRYRIRSAPYVVTEIDPLTNQTREIATSCGVADWIGQVEGDGRAIARAALTPAIERSEPSARQWLNDHLSEVGEAERIEVLAEADAAGFSESAVKRASRSLRVHSRVESGREPRSGRPFRRALWSLPKQGLQSVHPSPDGPNGPTGEGSHDLADLVSAGPLQSGQSGQLVLGNESEPTGDPTGEDPPCPLCKNEPLLDHGREICSRADDAHNRVRRALERVDYINDKFNKASDLKRVAKEQGDDALLSRGDLQHEA